MLRNCFLPWIHNCWSNEYLSLSSKVRFCWIESLSPDPSSSLCCLHTSYSDDRLYDTHFYWVENTQHCKLTLGVCANPLSRLPKAKHLIDNFTLKSVSHLIVSVLNLTGSVKDFWVGDEIWDGVWVLGINIWCFPVPKM